MTEKRFTDVWCSETGEIGLTDNGIDKTFTSDEFEDFLNSLNEVPGPIMLNTRISDEDFDEIKRIITEQIDNHPDMIEFHSMNRIYALQRENKMLKEELPFNKLELTHAINEKLSDVITSVKYGDVSMGCRIFAQNALIELKQELGLYHE